MFELVTFLVGLIFLAKYTFYDVKTQEVGNSTIIILYVVALIFAMQKNKLIPLLIVGGVVFLIFTWLWTKKYLGGADVKIIPAVVMLLSLNAQNIIADTLLYFVLLAVLTLIYGFFAIKIIKKEKIAFLPLITFSYLCMSFYQYIIA